MENMVSPYLEAIQGIPGFTPGEKYKTLSQIAKMLIDTSRNTEVDVINENVTDIPNILMPLVLVEVWNISRNAMGIVEALKSDDAIVFDRALMAKWFFDGTHETITSASYFEQHILPHVSLNNRTKIVKKLASCLQTSKVDRSGIAEEFYTVLSKKYGVNWAEPLLPACSRSFIQRLVVEERRVPLSVRPLKMIFRKHPEVIIEYLKLLQPSINRHQRKLTKISIRNYVDFLPRLLKNHANSFIEITEMQQSSLCIKLSRRCEAKFMKSGCDALIRSPRVFLPMLSLERITAKLTKPQFHAMLNNLLPAKIDEFNFTTIFQFLKYYSNDEKLPLLLSTFQEVYGVSLLDCEEKITPELLKVLPATERVKQARKKLEREKDTCNQWNLEKCWRCYLKVDESIPAIKTQIGTTSIVEERRNLLQQMIYTCSVNADEDALLETLKYTATRHKNEQGWVLLDALDTLLNQFKAETLSADHWGIINRLIQLLHVKNELGSRADVARRVVIKGIHFNLINDLPIDDKIVLLIEVTTKTWSLNWNILQDYPKYERRCLDAILTILPVKYPKNHKIWVPYGQHVTTRHVESLCNFNERNAKNPKAKVENLQMKNYRWLMEDVREILHDTKIPDYTKLHLARHLKAERDVYEAYVPEEYRRESVDFKSSKILLLLKKHPQRIKDNWEKYLRELTDNIHCRSAQRFMKSVRWHQELPVKFAEKCLTDVVNHTGDRSIMVLALLYDGATFERIVEPLAPKGTAVNIDGDDAKSHYQLTCWVPTALNVVNPPASLDLVLNFCAGDYVHMAVNSLANVGRRVSVDKVIPFAMKLMDRPVSIKKHGLRLFYLVASIEEVQKMSTNLLRTEKHRSIRAIVFNQIRRLFVDEPREETWQIMREAIDDLKPDDDAIATFVNTDGVPNEFIADYVRLILQMVTKLGKMQGGQYRQKALKYFNEILCSLLSAADYLPEELHQHILREYFANLSEPDYALSVVRHYMCRTYIIPAESKLLERLRYFSDLLSEIVKEHWDEYEESGFLPANHLVYVLTTSIVTDVPCGPVRKFTAEILFKAIFSVLIPQQDPHSYMYLTYAAFFERQIPSDQLAQKLHDVLPTMIAALSSEYTVNMAEALHEYVKLLPTADSTSWKLNVVENLLKCEDDNCAVFATALLNCGAKKTNDEQFWRIVKELKKHRHPTVVATVNRCINAFAYRRNV